MVGEWWLIYFRNLFYIFLPHPTVTPQPADSTTPLHMEREGGRFDSNKCSWGEVEMCWIKMPRRFIRRIADGVR